MTPFSFDPPLALASLSGQSDAAWARAGSEYAGAAMLGGIALDEPSRAAADELVARGRDEFRPADPIAFLDGELATLEECPIRPGFNVRSATVGPIREAARVCRDRDAFLEINAHCRQDELCAVGCGETLLRDRSRLTEYVLAASKTGVPVGVKVRAEVPGVDLTVLAGALEDAGASYVHVDAMDSEAVIADIVDATDLFVIANNGVRDSETVREYVEYGADAVSVGRPSDDPRVLERVRRAVDREFAVETGSHIRPKPTVADPTHGTQNATNDAFDSWRALQKATDKKRADLLSDIAGHPKGMPSVEELDYMNPSLSDDAIRRHLNTLADVDVVQEREFETGERLRDYPYKFYELTDAARELFDRNGLFPEEAWQRQYQSVEKTARIQDLEAMPRPDA